MESGLNRDRRLRLAVVGCGAVVKRFHLPALRRLIGVDLHALVETDPGQLHRLGARYPRAKLCRDVDELPQETDAALVAVPNALHGPIAVDLLRRGIHVLCEKPMATTVEACRKMVTASQEKGSILMVGHHKRFLPNVRQAKKLLDEGKLGAIRTVTGSMGLPRTWRSRTAFRLDPSLAGGGVLMDSGVHLIDLVLWLVGEIDLLRCYTLPRGSPIEEDARVEFLAEGGAVGVLRFSHRTVLPNVFRIEGEDGFLEFDAYDYASLKTFLRSVTLCRHHGSVDLRWAGTSAYQGQLEHFLRFVRGEEPVLLNSGEEAMRTISVVERAYAKVRCQNP